MKSYHWVWKPELKKWGLMIGSDPLPAGLVFEEDGRVYWISFSNSVTGRQVAHSIDAGKKALLDWHKLKRAENIEKREEDPEDWGNVLFVGGPKDGLWESFVLPLPSSYALMQVEQDTSLDTAEKEAFYQLEYLGSGAEQYPIYLWHDIPVYELVAALLRGYRQTEQ